MKLLFWIFLSLATALLTGLLWENPYLLLTILIAFLVIYFFFKHKVEDVLFFIVPFILGPASEIIAIKLGAWSYAQPQFYGIPFWLPVLWGISGLYIKNIIFESKKLIK